MPPKNTALTENAVGAEIIFESVDQIVTSNINNIDSDHFDKNLLLDIYRNL